MNCWQNKDNSLSAGSVQSIAGQLSEATLSVYVSAGFVFRSATAEIKIRQYYVGVLLSEKTWSLGDSLDASLSLYSQSLFSDRYFE